MKLKTRTNQPVYYKLPVSSNMEQLSDGLLNSLKVGDVVQKKTGEQKHCYIVSYKEEKHGICLTYVDGSGYMETISYDYTGGHWVFNSKDVTQVPSDSDIKEVIESASAGTIVDALGLDSNGDLVKGSVGGGGVQLYRHNITIVSGQLSATLILVSTSGDVISDNGNLGDNRFSLTNISKEEVVSILEISFPNFGVPPYTHIKQAICVSVRDGYGSDSITIEVISIKPDLTLKKCNDLYTVINDLTSTTISSVSDSVTEL